MRYHYKKPDIHLTRYGETYRCKHPVYNECTLYTLGDKGLAVIQQRYRFSDKSTYWGAIDSWLVDDIYLNTNFKTYFDDRSDIATEDLKLYPTVTVRQIMWALKIKPIKKERWETCFDRRYI